MPFPSLQLLFPRVGYTFSEMPLLTLALTHRSASAEHNERLEFLGDAILGFLIAEILYERFPDSSEGELTRFRSRLVRRKTLAELARQLKLGQYITLGSGELKSGGEDRESILANAFEAIIGAIYLDGGLDACHNSILHIYGSRLDIGFEGKVIKDPKTQLQELVQAMRLPLPEYRVIKATGADHQHWFTVECKVMVFPKTTQGSGRSRRLAEQDAAHQALKRIDLRGREKISRP
uniref:Ribonuclease 3 n=1 Tax=Candidatus Kentrum eta TaxID=2126337 RepID=A0A450VPY4_9GAMM|nr:MAG: RNAse III [Candidatus Kentron sp. H]VFK04100.1 MAG: RNAse III [Candidatus Kentron sp. H]VFK06837.1 MAG: RNAse III [Candidatus Kentron sp. H]